MSTKKETERSKLVQEKCINLITVMLKDEDNKYCVDCDAKGPRWASWNLGVFLCIRCAGIHRNLGVHITRVKSVNLDTWTPEQVASLQHMGNSRARAVYEAQLPDGFRRPQTDAALESFIRAKYEQKKYVAKEWVPSAAPKVDWEREIDEELEKQKRKKKSLAAAGGGSAILGSGSLASPSSSSSSAGEKKVTASSKPTPIPAPLSKVKSTGHSPKTGRPQLELSNASAVLSSTTTTTAPVANGSSSSNTLDLLGLSCPPPSSTVTSTTTAAVQDQSNGASDDEFNNFFSANSQARQRQQQQQGGAAAAGEVVVEKPRSLAQEEADFFNQSVPSDAEKARLTKDSIMALYASQPTTGGGAAAAAAAAPPHTQSQGPAALGAPIGNPNSNVNLLAGLGAGFPGQLTQQVNGGFPTQMQVQGGGGHFGSNGQMSNNIGQQQGQPQNQFVGGQFGAQLQQTPQQVPSQFMNGGGGGFYHNGTGGGIMGQQQQQLQQQQQQQVQGMNFFPTNGLGGFQPVAAKGGFGMPQQQQQQQMMMMMGGGLMGNGGGAAAGAAQFPYGAGMPPLQSQQANGGGGAGGMQKQFGNLNLGNVWQ